MELFSQRKQTEITMENCFSWLDHLVTTVHFDLLLLDGRARNRDALSRRTSVRPHWIKERTAVSYDVRRAHVMRGDASSEIFWLPPLQSCDALEFVTIERIPMAHMVDGETILHDELSKAGRLLVWGAPASCSVRCGASSKNTQFGYGIDQRARSEAWRLSMIQRYAILMTVSWTNGKCNTTNKNRILHHDDLVKQMRGPRVDLGHARKPKWNLNKPFEDELGVMSKRNSLCSLPSPSPPPANVSSTSPEKSSHDEYCTACGDGGDLLCW